MDNVKIKPNRNRRELKSAKLTRNDHYTQIDCLPGPMKRNPDNLAIMNRRNTMVTNKARQNMNYHMWHNATNIPGSCNRNGKERKYAQKLMNDRKMHATTAEL